MEKKQKKPPSAVELRRRERARELILSGMKKVQVKLQLSEEFGVGIKVSQKDFDAAQNECYAELRLQTEQVRVASAMYMGGYRSSRIVDALIDNWGPGGDAEVEGSTLDEERAEHIVAVATGKVLEETPRTKEEKRQWLGLWFEDKMMNAAKDRDRIRAAALFMRLEGLADLSEYEQPVDDIVIEVGDWRESFKSQIADGSADTAALPSPETETAQK